MDDDDEDLNIRNNNCIFIFIDKAIHATSLLNSQITVSISLHPSIYPVTSPPTFVKFNHIRFSFGLMIHFSDLLDGGIQSITELKLKIIIKENLTSRLIGKCLIPFNSNNESLISQFEYLDLLLIESEDSKENYFKFNFLNQKLKKTPYFFYQLARIPVFSSKTTNDTTVANNKNEICQIILSFAIGNENDKEKIIPTEAVFYETIRFKRNFKQESLAPISPSQLLSPRLTRSSNFKTSLPSPDISKNRNIIIYNNDNSDKNHDEYHKSIEKNRFKNNFNQIRGGKNRNINLTSTNDIQKRKNKNDIEDKTKPVSLTTDQIQYVIKNWKKYALQNGWSPPPAKKENQKDIFVKNRSVNSQNNIKTKFSGLLKRKLIKINNKPNSTNNKEGYIDDNDGKNIENNDHVVSSTKNDNIEYIISPNKNDDNSSKFNIKTGNVHHIENEKSFKKKNKFSKRKKVKSENSQSNCIKRSKKGSPSSVGPRRTTQYQMITDFSLDDAFLDKSQRNFNSDPPPHFSVIDDYDDINTSPSDSYANDNFSTRTVQSSPELLLNASDSMTPSSLSISKEFFSQDDEFKFCSPSLTNYNNQFGSESNNFESVFLPSEANVSSSSIDYQDNFKKSEKRRKECIEISDVDDITKSSFESLEAMIKVPPIPNNNHKKYTISHFDNIIDVKPKIKFGKKEIISIQVFKARPNPSEKMNTICYSMRSNQKSKLIKQKENLPHSLKPPLESAQSPALSSQMVIKKSPSLEKILQDGYMDCGINIEKLYEESSSED